MKPNVEILHGAMVSFRHAKGWRQEFLTSEQLEQTKKFPTCDHFAADHFGLSVNEYLSWISLEGNALCAGFTKRKRPCRAVIKNCYTAEEWCAVHRKELCFAHANC